MKKLSLVVISSLLLNSCVSYTHVMDAPQLTSSEKGLSQDAFAFKGTYTTSGFINKNHADLQIIDSFNIDFYEKKPTYNSIINRVHQVFGMDATFANVVWDIKHTNFLGLKGQKFQSVTFDVYVPIQK